MKPKTKHFGYTELLHFLQSKQQLTAVHEAYYRNHLDNCRACWNMWNKVRWDTAKGSSALLELQSYLGDKYREYFDSSWAIADDWNKKQPKTQLEIAAFYQQCPHYVYNLILWHESDREDFMSEYLKLRDQFHVTSVLDYGCGVGVDGLMFLESGTSVHFADFSNPSIKFLRWRLKKRKLSAPILDVKQLERYPAVDAFWAIDVLEHMVNPTETVTKLHDSTKLFVHRSQFSNTSGGPHPCHLPFKESKLAQALSAYGFQNVPWNTVSVWVRDV